MEAVKVFVCGQKEVKIKMSEKKVHFFSFPYSDFKKYQEGEKNDGLRCLYLFLYLYLFIFNQGGLPVIMEKLDALSKLALENSKILERATKLLEDEDKDDNRIRSLINLLLCRISLFISLFLTLSHSFSFFS